LAAQMKLSYAAIDDETLSDALEGLSNLPDIIESIIRSSLEDDILGLKSRLEEWARALHALSFATTRSASLWLGRWKGRPSKNSKFPTSQSGFGRVLFVWMSQMRASCPKSFSFPATKGRSVHSDPGAQGGPDGARCDAQRRRRSYRGQDKMSGFSKNQLRQLTCSLDRKRVHSRSVDGRTLDYIEGWFAVSEANQIFGYAGWDCEMVHFERAFDRSRGESVACSYVARVRVRICAGKEIVIREGTGFGQATATRAGVPMSGHSNQSKPMQPSVRSRGSTTALVWHSTIKTRRA